MVLAILIGVNSRVNLAVFGSGNGSNCRAILQAIRDKRLSATVTVIVSDRNDAGILKIASENDIPGYWICKEQYEHKNQFFDNLFRVLKQHKVDMIILAGYLRKIGPPLLEAYPERILNIHPALLPAFGGKGMYGLRVHRAVIESGVKVTGITVHIVDGEYDHGPIVLQKTLEVCDDDTPETLSEKVLQLEHRYYAQAIQYFAEGRCHVHQRRVIIRSTNS